MFAKLQYEGIRDFWTDLFCKSQKQEQCARKTLIKAGKPVPDALLPSGKRWDPLETIIMPRRKGD